MTQLRKHLPGRRPVETFSRSRVQPMRNGIELTLGIARQVRPLRQILPQQAIGVLIGATLPWAMWIGKEHLDGEPLGQPLVLGHFFASIISQRFAQRSWHMFEFPGKSLAGTLRIRPIKSCQDDQARRPLHEAADRRGIAGALDQVPFPVARHRTGRDVCGTLGNRRHIGDLAASVCSPCPRPTRFARLPQRGQQFAAQGAARQHVQGHIDGFGREAFPHVVRILVAKPSSNLFRRAPTGQACSDIPPQPGVQEFARPPGVTAPDGGQAVRRTGTIRLPPSGVAGVLAAHAARRSPQDGGHRSQRLPLGQAQA